MFIAVEGCVGAGKSTVAKGLALYRGSNLLLENFESNPFLKAFYEDPVKNATETEFAFLLIHFHQLKGQVEASKSEFVADFHLGKDLVYAELNLKDSRARGLFREMYGFFVEQISSPSLAIFLSASTNLLVERIRARERDFELEIDSGYYRAVNTAYEEYFSRYSGKKLRIPMDEWDFVQYPDLYERLASLVDRELDCE